MSGGGALAWWAFAVALQRLNIATKKDERVKPNDRNWTELYYQYRP